jgi:SAM-dependent methyltransferase
MALSISQTVALALVVKPGMRVASMGYPDLIAPFHHFEHMLGDKVHALEYRKDSQAICARHGLKDVAIPDAESFFKLMDCELDVYDIVKERGSEIICDLNHPIGPHEIYDIVLDVGTIEHCFNIAQAIMNMAGLVKQDGYIIHENPFNWGNHGFYNLNPTFYHNFYSANGFKLLECKLTNKHGGYFSPVPPTKRFVMIETEANMFAMAQRLELKPMVYPMQSKYAGLIAAQAAPVAGVDRAA